MNHTLSTKEGAPALPPQAALQLAQSCVQAGAWGRAMRYLERLAPEQLGRDGARVYWLCLGRCLGAMGQFTEALAAFDRALEVRQDCADALVGRAMTWAQLGEHGRCGRDASAALQLAPSNAMALQLQANALLKVGSPALALTQFARLEALRPATPFVGGLRLFLARRLGLWQAQGLPISAAEHTQFKTAHPYDDQRKEQAGNPTLALELKLLRQRAMLGMPALEPLASMYLFDDPQLHRQVAATWMRQWTAAEDTSRPADQLVPDGPLRVAYLSSDLYDHAGVASENGK